MKKYISVLELFTRNTIYKVSVLLAAMGTVQIFLFQKAMAAYMPMDTYHLDFLAIEQYSLEYIVDESKSAIVFAIVFVLLTVILCWNGCNIRSKSSYTLRRLQVTEKTVFGMQCLYNSLCYVLLLAMQVLVFLIQCHMYVEETGYATNQTVFLAFYRNDFMHSVLPLEGVMRQAANVLFVAGCGSSAAVFTYLQRRGKMAWSLLVVTACILVGFIWEMQYQYLGMAFAVIVCVTAGVTIYYHVFWSTD